MVKASAPLSTSITSTPSRSPPRRVRLEIVQLTSPGNFNSAEVMENPSKWTCRETSVSIQLLVAMMHHPIKRGISPQSPNELITLTYLFNLNSRPGFGVQPSGCATQRRLKPVLQTSIGSVKIRIIRTTKLKIRALLERILLGEILGVLGVLAVNAGQLFHRQDAKDAKECLGDQFGCGFAATGESVCNSGWHVNPVGC